MRALNCIRFLAPVVAVLSMAGCGSDPDKPYPVRGVIVYEDGEPAKELAGGSVTFMPTKYEDGRMVSSGSIDEDGSFILSCRKEEDGAIAGEHRVVIEPPEPEGELDAPVKKRQPFRRVIDPSSAVQQVTVEPKSNNLTLKVKRAASRQR